MTTTTDTTTINQVATVDEQGRVKPVVMMEDPIIHTASNGYRCNDHTCPYYAEAQAHREWLPLNGNRPFSLLR